MLRYHCGQWLQSMNDRRGRPSAMFSGKRSCLVKSTQVEPRGGAAAVHAVLTGVCGSAATDRVTNPPPAGRTRTILTS